ncbi:Flagellar M-ring protein [Buchnera aphidicola (Periphyllus testudinaceus)]|uniref:flagellar basal-body MS-ring/collar protein FliF n=1 Tax=Buchnera aphidicola TaxID=9 RepID=UPI003464C4A2
MNFCKKNDLHIKKKILNKIFFMFTKNKKFFILFLFLLFIIFSSLLMWLYYPNYKNFCKILPVYNNINFKKITSSKELYRNFKNKKFIVDKKDDKCLLKSNNYNINFKNSLPGFELLDEEKFGISSFNEKINYQRALEGELSRTIEKLNFINSARVHIAFPNDSFFLNEKNYTSASVFLNVNSNNSLNFEIYNSIISLLSTSVSNLPKKNITIINQFGELLSGSTQNFKNQIQLNNLNYINNIEYRYKKKIEDVLSPIFGINNVIVQVTAQFNSNSKKKSHVLYNPNTKIKNTSLNFNSKIKNKNLINLFKNFPEKNVGNVFYNKNSKNLLNNKFYNNKINFILKKKNIIKNNILSYKDKKFKINKNVYDKFYPDFYNNKLNFKDIKNLSVSIIINYKKNSKGEYFPLNSNEISYVKKLTNEVINFSELRRSSVNVFNVKFMDIEPPIVKYIPIKKKETINRMLFLAPWFLLFFFSIFFITSFYSFKKLTKKFQNNSLSILSVLNQYLEKNEQKQLIKKNIKKNNNDAYERQISKNESIFFKDQLKNTKNNLKNDK